MTNFHIFFITSPNSFTHRQKKMKIQWNEAIFSKNRVWNLTWEETYKENALAISKFGKHYNLFLILLKYITKELLLVSKTVCFWHMPWCGGNSFAGQERLELVFVICGQWSHSHSADITRLIVLEKQLVQPKHTLLIIQAASLYMFV